MFAIPSSIVFGELQKKEISGLGDASAKPQLANFPPSQIMGADCMRLARTVAETASI